jgi:hypothetical protein
MIAEQSEFSAAGLDKIEAIVAGTVLVIARKSVANN